jgi:hypothetical protein
MFMHAQKRYKAYNSTPPFLPRTGFSRNALGDASCIRLRLAPLCSV